MGSVQTVRGRKSQSPIRTVPGLLQGCTDGLPEIVPKEAEIVKFIYRMFIDGMATNAIAKLLTQRRIPTPAGKETWMRQTVESILRNEKYKGAALLQKKFTVDFLQKKMKVNEGEVPQYYIRDD